ncbi:mannitol-1-phosphate dehydrogenase [Talaromyces stipitatus ATCC 10500]|uniref:Mannitol-1-phosphate 5-dehydrogenase n=1 Tax=Talaromyces stipitatus (strain ATCC 10500 / CBS 375.48 / QM 6759 / NRRL 1006) TaxID=441959 RepID=B8M8R7_TALSN|nr:mannitol-1-phosphate dehydrogenase [Talaromyces stipitatus ATCC 10500]EED20580.1 mannitol-1-phosphate dehydrogenase [Talaromyces stipitatus ATCC 10500]
MGKKAIQFGGGNIGRGFVAEFLHQSGYEVVFIDVVPQVIESLNNTKSYEVTEISEEGEKTKTITNFRALSSKTQEPEVVKEIATADVVTCAVGPNVLKFIAPVIAKGIDSREADRPLAVIACENAINATDTLRGHIEERLDKSRLDTLPKRARFANSAIDRIVPTQPENAGLNVRIEKFYEWVVEQTPFGEYGHPDISAIHWVDHLEPYIERKLFTVNTGHATAAYYGYQLGKKTIHDALADKTIHKQVHAALDETASLIVSKHEITEQEQKEYVETIVSRISNPYLEDVVERVGRAPLRKLSRNERFIGPAAQLAERGMKFDALLLSIEKALQFQNVEGDDESAELAKILKEKSAADATQQITGLETGHPLYQHVLKVFEKVQAESNEIMFYLVVDYFQYLSYDDAAYLRAFVS